MEQSLRYFSCFCIFDKQKIKREEEQELERRSFAPALML